MKFFFLSAHNKPSGGTKVLNQMVNLCNKKGYESYLVTIENNPQKANFLEKPCNVIGLNNFKEKCKEGDIIINCWQHKLSHQAVENSTSKTKIFWQHGTLIPVYPDFNGEEIFKSKIYNQYWNVSEECANFIQKKYNLNEVDIVRPFFDDKTLLKYTANIKARKGVLIVRGRGQEAVSDIINLFPKQKITILNAPFKDYELYQELIKHKFFISLDNGLDGNILIKNKYSRIFKKLAKLKNNFLKPKKWIKHNVNYLGFPITACEAAWLGTPVIGFAMVGGLEWMTNNNMYLAKDGDINSLLEKIKKATEATEENLKIKKENAIKAVNKFNKDNTWRQITELLKL